MLVKEEEVSPTGLRVKVMEGGKEGEEGGKEERRKLKREGRREGGGVVWC